MDKALADKRENLTVLIGRLSLLPAHAALFLLRNALAIPKLLYTLRTSPCSDSAELASYDATVKSALSSILNIDFSPPAWTQASLPLRWGGIGVRSALQLAPSAFLASAAGATELLSLLLPTRLLNIPDPAVALAEAAWRVLGGSVCPVGGEAHTQRKWDEGICGPVADSLLQGADEVSLARLLASRAPSSGAWLSAVPTASLGLNLDNSAVRVAVGLRLGVPLVLEHQCACGTFVDRLGYHGLSCKRSAGRHLRHNLLNDIIQRGLQSANVASIREPPGLLRSDAKRPDGATLVPWSRGKCLIWDATCPDTLAPSYVRRSSVEAGASATLAEARKQAKYSSLSTTHDFVPVAIETLGAWGSLGAAFVNELGRRITAVSGDSRATAFLKQRLALAVQRGNAAAVLGTFAALASEGLCE